MMQDENRAIRQFQSRLRTIYVIKYSLAALAIWAFAYGSVVLALRGALGVSRTDLLWGLCSLPVAVIPVMILAWRRVPELARVRAVLDRHSHAGGLLMAGEEQPLGDWEKEIPRLRQPVLKHRSGRGWGLFALGVAFVALAFAVPEGFAHLPGSALDISRDVEKLNKQLDILEKEKILEKQRASDLKTRLEQVRQEARAKDPSRTLDALDHLQDLANQAARESAEATARKMEELARAETLAEAVDKLASQLEPGQLDEAFSELASMASKAASEQELLESGLDAQTLEELKSGKLSPETAKKLAEALKNCKEGKLAKIGRLVKAKLLNADALEKCEKAGKCDCEGLAAFLKENGVNSELSDLLADSEMPGRGGVTRGPGPAKLDFGDESSLDGTKFKEEELPPSELRSLKDSQLSGLSLGSPDKGKDKGRPSSGALSGARVGGGSANTQIVLPRHRGTVERYFERSGKK